MPPDEQKALLKDILDAAQRIQNYVQNMSREKFLKDDKTQDAVAMQFLVLGEAAGDLTKETRALFPNLPFHLMAGQRNIIAHTYGRVNFSRIYDTACKDTALLVQEISQFFEEEKNQ